MTEKRLTRSVTLKGDALRIEDLAFRTLRITPDASLSSRIVMDATFGDQAEFDRIVAKEGRAVSLSCDRARPDLVGGGNGDRVGVLRRLFGRGRNSMSSSDGVTLDISLGVPPAFPLEIVQGGSGLIEVGPITGPLVLDLSGSLTFRGESCGPLDLDLEGSSSVRIGHVAGSAELDLVGSSPVTLDDIDVEVLRIDVSGSCTVSVGSGRAGRLSLDASTVRKVGVGATVLGDAEVRMSSVGDVTLHRVMGKVERDHTGIGVLRVNGRRMGN